MEGDVDENNGWKDVGVTSDLFTGGDDDDGGPIGGWTFSNLLSRFGHVRFRFSDTHGEMMSLETYSRYVVGPEGMSDDSPLGIYDSEFGDGDSPTSALVDEYEVPSCFGVDLFELADRGYDGDDGDDDCETTGGDGCDDDNDGGGIIECERSSGGSEEEGESDDEDEEQNHLATTTTSGASPSSSSRPPYRWILIGPERSGTGMHVDPLRTDAWVTVLQGRKRWLLFPPDTPHDSVGMVEGVPQIPSSIWFREYYHRVTSTSWPAEHVPTEVLQLPGETVYVPSGWPHVVLNLELTVAVTHNYAREHHGTEDSFREMWEEIAREEPEFAARWHAGLVRNGREDLARAAPEEIIRRASSSSP